MANEPLKILLELDSSDLKMGAVNDAIDLAHFTRPLGARLMFTGAVSEELRAKALAMDVPVITGRSRTISKPGLPLFAGSVLGWLAARLLRNRRATWVVALVVSALLFGAAHLPAWLAAAHVTFGLVAGVLVLNGVGGLLLGWIFWRWGLPYAILCHFVGDVVVQALGPRLLS